jgi:hypothetical protein
MTFRSVLERTRIPGQVSAMNGVLGPQKSVPDLVQVSSIGGLPKPSLRHFVFSFCVSGPTPGESLSRIRIEMNPYDLDSHRCRVLLPAGK